MIHPAALLVGVFVFHLARLGFHHTPLQRQHREIECLPSFNIRISLHTRHQCWLNCHCLIIKPLKRLDNQLGRFKNSRRHLQISFVNSMREIHRCNSFFE